MVVPHPAMLPAPWGLTSLPAILLVLLPTLLSACASSPDLPPWFDSLHRLPIRQVTVNGHRIAYLEAGQGPPVILIHGFGGSMWQWEYQHAALAPTHRVINLDLLGSGLSDKPDLAYTPDQMVEIFLGFMDALGLPRASLVGNSMGGGLAIAMAVAHPERVDRLVLIGGLPDRIHEKLTSPLIRRSIETRAPIWLIQVGNWLAGRGLTERVLQEIVHDHSLLTPLVIERSYRNRQTPGLLRPLMTMARNLQQWEEGFARRLHEIQKPTLILWGEEDRVFPPEVGRGLQAAIPGSKLVVIPKAGHIPQWERPDEVNKILVEYLQP